MAKAHRKLPTLTEQDRQHFFAQVKQGSDSECWLWTGGKSKTGYGQFNVAKSTWAAHRIAYYLHHNEDPGQLLVRHLVCDNPPCCNPMHLEKGTDADNKADCVRKGRQPRGDRHPLFIHPERRPRGESHGCAKLKTSDILEIRSLWAQGGISKSELSRRFKVDRVHIRLIINRRTWKHI